MSLENKEIVETINSLFVKDNYSYSEYILTQLKKPEILSLFKEIMNKSNKTISEVVIVFLAALRFVEKDINALTKIEKTKSFDSFVNKHYHDILEVSIKRKVQANIPERGLPILEILGKEFTGAPIGVIELGASYGLIGSSMLNPNITLWKQNDYFKANQKMPGNPKEIDYYLGIDIDPPEKDWLLACLYEPGDAKRMQSYIDHIDRGKNFELIKASALGFSKLKEVIEFTSKNMIIVVLTSFMLYQLAEDQQNILKDEILKFTRVKNRHWIQQEVELFGKKDEPEYYIALDGKKIISLEDDKCGNWKWINP